MTKAIIFIRVSTDKQEYASQEKDLRAHANADGFTNENIITIGNIESGYKLDEEERIGIKTLKDEIAKGYVNTIYIWEITRLSRKPKVIYSIRDILLEHKIQLKCLKPLFHLLQEDRSDFDSTANIVLAIMGALGEQEIVEKKERFKRGKKRLAEQGKYSGGRIPYAYTLSSKDNKTIIINDEEANIVRLIYNLYQGGMSQTLITDELRSRGYKYHSFKPKDKRREKDINIGFVNQILTNELYTGRKCKGESSSYFRSYPQIIPEEQFDNCRAIAKKKKTNYGKRRNIYYASKLITCPECDGNFSSSGSKVAYRCYNANIPNTMKKLGNISDNRLCNNKTSISINVIDSLLWQLAQTAEVNYIFTAAKKDEEEYLAQKELLNTKLANIEPRLSKCQESKKRAGQVFARGLWETDDLEEEINKIKEEENLLYKEQTKYLSVISRIDELLENINSAYTQEDSAGIANQFEKIEHLRERISLIVDDEERSKIIHRHIKSVSVSKTERKEIDFISGTKMASVKFVTVYFYNGNVEYFCHVSNGGGRSRFIISNLNKELFEDYEIVFLRRFTDKTKLVQKKKALAKRQRDWEAAFSPDRVYKKGLQAIGKYLHMAPSTVLKHINLGHLDGAYQRFQHDQKTYVFDVELCVEKLRSLNNPWVNRSLDKMND